MKPTRLWTTWQWRVLTGGGGGIGLILLLAFLGCTPEKRYETLSLFFDGVPLPQTATTGPTKSSVRTGAGGKVTYIHQPFSEQKCASCHLNTEDIFARAKVKPDVCLTCHGGLKTQYKYMHGPFANNVCIMCHVPHTSSFPHLLRLEPNKVCNQCHETGALGPNPPEHLNPKASCINCHSGHGGNDRTFLLAHPRTPATNTTNPARIATTREVKK